MSIETSKRPKRRLDNRANCDVCQSYADCTLNRILACPWCRGKPPKFKTAEFSTQKLNARKGALITRSEKRRVAAGE